MTVKDLKMSLSRLPGDLDDVEIFVNYVTDSSQLDYDYLAFTSYTELPVDGGKIIYMLGTEKAAHMRIRSGTLTRPDGTKITDPNNINEE
jgi:hypothetical protein